MALNTRSISGLLSVAVGSSRMRRRASRTRRRAISTSCRSPIESDSTAVPSWTWRRPSWSRTRACVLGEPAAPVDEGHVEPSEKDVVLDAELGHEAQLLVHERDAVGLRVMWVAERDLLAVEADHALVRPHEPDERLDESALAGAVVPADRVHLADPDVEREAPHCAHRAVGLGEVDDLEDQRCNREIDEGERDPDAVAGSRSPSIVGG